MKFKNNHELVSMAERVKSINPGITAILSLVFGIIGQIFLFINKNIPIGMLFFIIAIICFIIADKHFVKNNGDEKDIFQISFPISMKTEIIMFSIVFIIAVFMRLFKLDEIPAGCFYDEALNGLTAIDILNGKSLPIYVGPQAPNNAAVYMYYIAAIFKLFGIGATQIRLTSAVLGILAIPAFYFLIRYLVGPIPALTAAFMLAVMRWHIIFSRIGFHAVFAVIVFILVLYFIVRAYFGKKLLDFIFLGATLSFSLYTYQSARLIPVVLFVFILYLFFKERNFFKENFRKIIMTIIIAAAVFLPLGIYITGNFNAFMNRQSQVSIFNQDFLGKWSTQDQSWQSENRTRMQHFLDNVKDHLLMFNYMGDSNERHNLPGQPELDFFTGIFVFIGFGYALARLFQPVYFLFVSSFFILMTAGFLTIESPQSLRTILAIPCVIFFMLVFIGKFLSFCNANKAPVSPIMIIGAMLLFSSADNFNMYFNKQARDPRCWEAFSTQEYSAGKIVRSALLSGYNAMAVPFYVNHPSFRFALNDIAECDIFNLFTSIPALSRDNKNFLYLLPTEYISMLDYLKELYPHGTTTYFTDKNNDEPLFFYYTIPASDLENHKWDISKNGANVTYFSRHGFADELLQQKVPVILLTWYDNSNILSAIWRAKLNVPAAGDYVFKLGSRGYSSLYIDKRSIVGNSPKGVSCDVSENSAQIHLSKGIHSIEVKYDSSNSSNTISYGCTGLWLSWQKPGDKDKTLIPGSLLYPD
jgi:4-amino-4-deoxy-L-arabinose transferase-like glycosyltransferase